MINRLNYLIWLSIIGLLIACPLASPAFAQGKMFKFHHLGIITKDMDKSNQSLMEIIGVSPDDPRIDKFIGKENKTTMLPLGNAEDHKYFEVMQPYNMDWMDEYFKT
jgi:hypothetical protein